MSTLVIASDTGGCGHYRAKLVARHLGYDYTVGFPAIETKDQYVIVDKRVDDAKAVILQRIDGEFFPIWIPEARANGQVVVYDIDDNIWEIPKSNHCHAYFDTQRVRRMTNTLSMCDAVTVSTRKLQQYILNRFHRNVIVVPNMVERCEEFKTVEKPVIGWWGSSTHAADFTPELKSFLYNIASEVRVIFIGYKPFNYDKIDFIDWVPSDDLVSTIYKSGVNILMAPVQDTLFNRCKSNIKFLEAGACGICTIASDVAAYNQDIIHGHNGFLVKSQKDWLTHARHLICNIDILNKVRRNAHEYVNANYTWQHSKEELQKIYDMHITGGSK